MTASPRARLHRAVSLLLLVSPVAVAGGQTERRALAGERVAIYNLAGRLRVEAGNGNDVSVDITRGGPDASRLSIATGPIRGAQTLRVVYPSNQIVYPALLHRTRTQLRVDEDGTFDDRKSGRDWFSNDRVEIRDSGSGLDAHADLVVRVPKGQSIVVHWGVGDATITNVDGDIRLSVAAASVATEHTRGSLELDTGSGGVTVTDAQGTVSLDTGSGGVTIAGVRGDELRLDAGSGSVRGGDIEVQTLKVDVGSGGLRLTHVKSGRVSADVGSGGLELDLTAPVTDLAVDAGSGGVTIRLPAAQGAELDIETGSGGIESDFAIQTNRMSRNHVRGRIGDGRGRIKIESGSGTVRLIKN
jgi:lia operon protein LiaG